MIALRPYQHAAIDALWRSLQQGQNAVAQLPTGTGKSLIIAELLRLLHSRGGRVWVMTHIAELVQQNADTYARHTGHAPGIVCAGLNRRDVDEQIIFCSVQTMCGVKNAKPPNLIIIDEVHRVPHGSGSQYESVFSALPSVRRLGLSATPWRTDNGLVYGKGEGFWFDSLAYVYTVPQAVGEGWLAPLVGVETTVQLELPEPPSSGDFSLEEVAERQTLEWMNAALHSAVNLTRGRKHVAVYCPTVVSAMRAVVALTAQGHAAEFVHGSMPMQDRQDTLRDFKSGKFKFLCSVDTLTTGWDFPALDCIVCLRPTTASNLWVQIMGRGTRLSPGKANCLLLDYVGNLQRLGGVDMLETYVRQSAPQEPVEAVPAPPREPRKVYPGVRTLAVLDPTSGEQARDGATLTVEVHGVNCVAVTTRRNLKEPVLLVQYACTTAEGARIDASAFITTATENAEAREFFALRGLAVNLPSEARRLMWQAKGARKPLRLVVRKQGKYWNMQSEIWSNENE